MALLFECMQQCARKVLDTADIVRDRDIVRAGLTRYGAGEEAMADNQHLWLSSAKEFKRGLPLGPL